jgi:hypothetical protein
VFGIFEQIERKQHRLSINEKVRHILDRYPEARNNDKMLCRLYWQIFDNVKRLEDLDHATNPEFITRERRKLNEVQLYMPTDPNVRSRRKRTESHDQQMMLDL